MTTPALISTRGYSRLTKESTWSTPLASTLDLPTETRDIAPVPARISPNWAANIRSRDLVFVKGRQYAAGRLGGQFFSQATGHVLMGTLGTDVISGAGPYTHTMKAVQTAALPSYTVEINHGGLTGASTSEQFAGLMVNTLTLTSKFDQDDATLDWAADVVAVFPTLVTPVAYAGLGANDTPAAASACTLTYGGSNWAKAMEFTCVLNNNLVQVKTGNAGSLDLQNLVPTDVMAHGTARIVFDAYTSEYADFTAMTSRAMTLTWTFKDGSTLLLNIAVAILENWKWVDRSSGIVEATFDWKSSHDSASGGPLNAVLINNRSTAY